MSSVYPVAALEHSALETPLIRGLASQNRVLWVDCPVDYTDLVLPEQRQELRS